MTVLEREMYRAGVMQRELEKAYQAAAIYHLSSYCREAMQVTGRAGADPGRLHAECREEEPGGRGCLCFCHDEHRSGVSSGTAVEMSSDARQFLDS